MFTAALIGAGAVGVAGAAGAAGAVYKHKKKLKEEERIRVSTIHNMAEQWAGQRSNLVVDTSLYPKAQSEIADDIWLPLDFPIVSFAVGWGNQTVLTQEREIQFLAAAFDEKGRKISVFTPDTKTSNIIPTIKHSGYPAQNPLSLHPARQSDKQEVNCDLANLPENVHHILVGNIMKTSSVIYDPYVALYNPQNKDEPLLINVPLNSQECGSCNGYILGVASKTEGKWVYKPIQAPFSARGTEDIVARMQLYVIPSVTFDSEKTKISFRSSSATIQAHWLSFDRFGFKRGHVEEPGAEAKVVEDYLTHDSITKHVVFVKQSEKNPVTMIVDIAGNKTEYPISDDFSQIACVINANDWHLNIPFPTVPQIPDWSFVPVAVPVGVDSPEEFLQEAKLRYIPFTANSVILTVYSGQNLVAISEKKVDPSSPKKEKDRKPVDAVVKVILDGEEKKTGVIKKNSNPVWDAVFEFPLTSDYFTKECTATFNVKDKSTHKRIGECAYCLKSLSLPFVGSLTLSGNPGSALRVGVNVVEK